jgi:hypothetical protein
LPLSRFPAPIQVKVNVERASLKEVQDETIS